MTTRCRISGEPLLPVLDLGTLYVSNFFDSVRRDAPTGRLQLGLGERSGLLQLMETVPADRLYQEYWYRSGTNSTMPRQLQDIVSIVPRWVRIAEGDHVLDIGCNDGTLLKQYPAAPKVVKVGIDPARNLAPLGREACDLHANDYFSKDVYLRLTGGVKAKVITSIAMFYDLDDPHSFVEDIRQCLADRGIWILQLSYTPLMLEQNAFDNICHEHIEYYSLESIDGLFRAHGLRIISVELNGVNAGSFRLVVTHESNDGSEMVAFERDVGRYQYNAFKAYEHETGANRADAVHAFGQRVEARRTQTVALLSDLRKQGKRVYGYGASTKGNTLLQYYGIDPSLVTAIAERQTQKVGKLTAGSWIPIIGEDEMRAAAPDYLFVLPWHFFREFQERESELVRRGTKFIVPLPDLQVIG